MTTVTTWTASRSRSRLALVAALLTPALLAGCGADDPIDSYCELVGKERPGLTRTLDQSGGTSGLLPALPVFERLEDAAPDDIADDWSVVVQRLRALADALEAAGADPSTYDPVDPPDGVTKDQQEAIKLAAGSLATESVVEALQNVDQQARDVCKGPLLGTGSSSG